MSSCVVCNNHHHYNEEFDSYYCDPCDEWYEQKCPAADCELCCDRPDRPSLVLPEDVKEDDKDQD